MKKQMFKKVSIVVAALLLLAAMPVSSLAEKLSEAEVQAAVSADREVPAEISADVEVPTLTSADTVVPEKATDSDAVLEKATSSDAYEDGELLDGFVSNDIVSSEKEEVPAEEATVPGEVPAPAAEVPAEITEKKEAIVPADISGTWTIDGVTSYRFEEDGTGALVLPEHEYRFEYSVEENELTLEFESSRISQAVFTITQEGDTITLIKEENAGNAEFILTRTDS